MYSAKSRSKKRKNKKKHSRQIITIKVNIAGSGDPIWRKINKIGDVQESNMFGFTTERKGGGISDCMGDFFRTVYKSHNKKDNKDGEVLKKFEEMYGEQLDCARKKYPDITLFRKINKDKKTRTYYCNGPLSLGGTTDWGNTNIEHIVDCLLDIIPSELIKLANKKKDCRFHIKVKGHSRGAVAAGIFHRELSKKIKEIGLENRLLEKPSLTQLDPVFGDRDPIFGLKLLSSSSEKKYGKYDEIDVHDEDESSRSEVVFSVNPKGSEGLMGNLKGLFLNSSFTMQRAVGHKVIVITEEAHDVGTERVGFDEDFKPRKQFYTGKDGKRIKIKDLDCGIYYAVKGAPTMYNGTPGFEMEIQKIDSYNFSEYIDKLDEKVSSTRDYFLKELICDKFVKNEDVDKIFEMCKRNIQNLEYGKTPEKQKDFAKSCVLFLSKLRSKLMNDKHLFYKFRIFQDSNVFSPPSVDAHTVDYWENCKEKINDEYPKHLNKLKHVFELYLGLIDMIIKKMTS